MLDEIKEQRRPGRHVHRRAAHRRRRRRDRRGRDGRRQHAQADAGPRRAAHGRRDHARRVPRAHREGPGAGAPVPAGLRRRAVASRTPSRSCAGSRSATRRTTRSQIADAALVAAATLSDRYITARFLPDKAIDLVDEAASRLRMEIDSRPVEIDELQRAGRPAADGGARARQGDRRGLASSGWRGCARDLADRQEQLRRADRPLGAGEGRPQPGRRAEEAARRAARRRPSGPSATATSRPPPGCCTPRSPRWSSELAEASAEPPTTARRDGQGGGRPRRHRRGRRRPGPASRPAGCSRARPPSCCAWRTSSAAG